MEFQVSREKGDGREIEASFLVDIEKRSVRHVGSGLIVDFIEDPDARGVWFFEARNLEILGSASGNAGSALLRETAEAFVSVWKAHAHK